MSALGPQLKKEGRELEKEETREEGRRCDETHGVAYTETKAKAARQISAACATSGLHDPRNTSHLSVCMEKIELCTVQIFFLSAGRHAMSMRRPLT